MKVFVAHPVRQHVRWLLGALESQGMLHSFWTLLPDSRKIPPLARFLIPRLHNLLRRNDLPDIPKERIRTLYGPIIFQRVFARAPWAFLRDFGELITWTIFDRWVSKNLARLKPDLVIGYEMCSEKTFRQAKNMGIPCVLDAAACHFRWVDQQLESKFYSKKFHPSKSLRLRKLNETRLADWIVCPSNLAKRTYTNQFIPQENVLVNSLGYDPYNFTPGRSQPSNRYRPPTFVYVGQLANHKGLDILLEAFRQTITKYPDVILKVIGPKLSIPVKSSKNINVLGRFTSDQLAGELASSDCLVLPSRADSYGLVVLEALAMGVPVIVSENAGVTEVIRNGENGWTITPNSVRALTLRMVACVKNIQQLRSMSNSCRDSVKDLTWDRYQKRSISLYLTLCEDARAQQ